MQEVRDDVIVHDDADGLSEFRLRWVGELDAEREHELEALLRIEAADERQRRTKRSVLSWLSGLDVVQDVDAEKPSQNAAKTPENDKKDLFNADEQKFLFNQLLFDAALMRKVLFCAGAAAVCRFARCSTQTNEWASDDRLWELLTLQRFGNVATLDTALNAGGTWKGAYKFLAMDGKGEDFSVPSESAFVSPREELAPLFSVLEKLHAELGDSFPDTLESLRTFVSRYQRIRIASKNLAALGKLGLEALKCCGFVDDGKGFLVVEIRNKELARHAREALEVESAKWSRKGANQFSQEFSVLPDEFETAQKGHAVKPDTCIHHFAVHDSIGRREEMEDDMTCERDVFAVFDGHAGAGAAKVCALGAARVTHAVEKKHDVKEHEHLTADRWNQIACEIFELLHANVVALRLSSGCTAVLAQIDKFQFRWAHAGDARAVLVKMNGHAIRLTEDHKPRRPDERRRIVQSGGRVVRSFFSRVYRINGEIAISRAIGDVGYEKWGLIHVPETGVRERSSEDLALVLACDGVWDVLNEAAVGRIVGDLQDGKKNLKQTAERIVAASFAKGSTDNLSCIVIDLRDKEDYTFF